MDIGVGKIMMRGEERDYSRSIVSRGAKTGFCGLFLGIAAVAGLQSFYPSFRQLPLYIKSTSVMYPGAIATSLGANHASQAFQSRTYPETRQFLDQEKRQDELSHARGALGQRAMDWLYNNQYYILGGTWASTMAICLARMGKDAFTPRARQIVQARVLAQASTLAVLIMTAAIEAKDKWQGRGKYQPIVFINHKELREK